MTNQLLTDAQFCIGNPDVLHTPAQHREIIKGLLEANGGRTGWPPGLLQDDCNALAKWFANQPDARRRVYEALEIGR